MKPGPKSPYLEARVDALHAASFVGVGDFASNSLLAFHLGSGGCRPDAVLEATKTADHFSVFHREIVVNLFGGCC